jgi:Diacylglycerol kinase catalytic domain
MSRRLGALIAILGGAAALALALYVFVVDFPRGLIVLGCVAAALATAWYALLRRGWRRWLAIVVGLLLLGAAIVLIAGGDNGPVLILVAISFAAGVAGARVAFRPERSLPRAVAPRHPVLFLNPWSGEGEADEVGLAEEAKRRGIETVELQTGDDLQQLARAAVGRGADGLAMAGGDGSQALVAAIAAEHDLPYACIPSGTRNHFALDLGVDREDPVGALDAFVDGGERYVDLGEVNGQVFVNNVSLGVYAEAVSQDDYNAYRLGPTLGSGTRPHLDRGVLGIVDFHPPIAGEPESAARWRELTAAELEIECDSSIPVAIDGEPAILEPPLRFRIRPKALRARVAHEHPGASPSAEVPRGLLSALKELLRISVSPA